MIPHMLSPTFQKRSADVAALGCTHGGLRYWQLHLSDTGKLLGLWFAAYTCLNLRCQMIPSLKRLDIHTSGEEEMDGVFDNLPINVRIAAQESLLGISPMHQKKTLGALAAK